MITPRSLSGDSPEEDPTGVRALLSSLPEPGPMPAYLVERISASLAAEQAKRTKEAGEGAPVSPAVRPGRQARGRRLIFTAAGAAAAMALIAVVGPGLLHDRGATGAGGAAASLATGSHAGPPATTGSEGPPAGGGATKNGPDHVGTAPEVVAPVNLQIRATSTRYTPSDFAAQATALAGAADRPAATMSTGDAATAGPVGTVDGLESCLKALGLTGVGAALADLSFYDGRPAAVLVVERAGSWTAYAVRRDCSSADPALLHAATPLAAR